MPCLPSGISVTAHVHKNLLDHEIQLVNARLRLARFERSCPDELLSGMARCAVRGHR